MLAQACERWPEQNRVFRWMATLNKSWKWAQYGTFNIYNSMTTVLTCWRRWWDTIKSSQAAANQLSSDCVDCFSKSRMSLRLKTAVGNILLSLSERYSQENYDSNVGSEWFKSPYSAINAVSLTSTWYWVPMCNQLWITIPLFCMFNFYLSFSLVLSRPCRHPLSHECVLGPCVSLFPTQRLDSLQRSNKLTNQSILTLRRLSQAVLLNHWQSNIQWFVRNLWQYRSYSHILYVLEEKMLRLISLDQTRHEMSNSSFLSCLFFFYFLP